FCSMLTVVLVEPESEGNLGAVARLMKNFDFRDLLLINPQCDYLSQEALDRATHAKDILRHVRVEKDISCLGEFDYLIATTSKVGTDYNIPRIPIKPEELSINLDLRKKVALLIGRESTGLRNEEIMKADLVVTIPVSKKFPAMNMSHACGIILYEIFKAFGKEKVGEHIPAASKREKDQIMILLDEAMKKLTIPELKQETQRRVWKRMLGRSFLARREAFALMGLLKKVIGKR
ncbi:TrmJ/YjtD family RNA methyltransferase, partial [Candidatus Woesearchaeota archaeon]|nr:TrmJ/YjtD family RNA methyltransferase [Candidatus Woesearchaeota archaeon]